MQRNCAKLRRSSKVWRCRECLLWVDSSLLRRKVVQTYNRLFLLPRLEIACYQIGMTRRPNTILWIIPGLRDRGGA